MDECSFCKFRYVEDGKQWEGPCPRCGYPVATEDQVIMNGKKIISDLYG